MKINLKKLVISILIPLSIGYISSLLIKNQLYLYDMFEKPWLAPHKNVFAVVWSVLYVLMGISFYFIWNKKIINADAVIAYGLQLFFNFFWPILFFNGRLLFISLVWLILLGIILIDTIYIFYKENKVAAILLIPYLVWILFAIYLNGAIYFLN